MFGGKDQWPGGGLWDTLQSACCHSKWAQSFRLGTRSLSSLSQDLVKIPALISAIVPVSCFTARWPRSAINQSAGSFAYFASNERRHDERQRVAVTQARAHSFPLRDLMDSLRYKNRPAVHYVIPLLLGPMCSAPLYKYIS